MSKDLHTTMQLFLQEKSEYLQSDESFHDKFNKSCTNFEKLLAKSATKFLSTPSCSEDEATKINQIIIRKTRVR